jgi:YD repeat-containing protein
MRGALKLILIPLAILFSARCAVSQAQVAAEDGKLNGIVRSVRVERACRFDSNGRPVEGRRVPITETTFNVEGKQVERVRFKFDGSVEEKIGYTYDADGRLAETVFYDPDGTAAGRWTYDYDEAGRKVEDSTYSREGQITLKQRYAYDADGSLALRSEFLHDAKGRISNRTDYKADGAVEGRYVYKYDADGNLKRIAKDKRIYFHCAVVPVEEQFTPVAYDAYGNWTKAVGAVSVAYRTITYH